MAIRAVSAALERIGGRFDGANRADDDYVAAARAQLDATAFDSAWRMGRSMPLEGHLEVVHRLEAVAREHPDQAAALHTKPAYPAGITEREVEMLRLVTQGLTNAQIGERLVVRPRSAPVVSASTFKRILADAGWWTFRAAPHRRCRWCTALT